MSSSSSPQGPSYPTPQQNSPQLPISSAPLAQRKLLVTGGAGFIGCKEKLFPLPWRERIKVRGR